MQVIIDTRQIVSIQLHVFNSHLFTFHNTFFVESFRKYGKGIVFVVVDHEHPTLNKTDLPFAIVNETFFIPKPRLMNLLEAVTLESPTALAKFQPIFQLCEQISAVGRIMSEQPSNPYWLFFSPIKKYQIYRWNNMFKKQVYERSQYFNAETEELNRDYFIYQVDCLATYINFNVGPQPLTSLCVYSMLKSIKLDKVILYEAIMKNQTFERFEKEGIKLLVSSKANDIKDPRYISTIVDHKTAVQQPNRNENERIFADDRLEFLSRLIPAAAMFTVIWKSWGFTSKN